MKKWSKKEQDLIIKLVLEAKKCLNMQTWVVYNNFIDGEIKLRERVGGDTFLSLATNIVTSEYEKIVINWQSALLKDIREKQLADVRETVYHELIHGLTQELYETALDRYVTEKQCMEALERLNQRITRIVCMQT